jgi:hypothetical protein
MFITFCCDFNPLTCRQLCFFVFSSHVDIAALRNPCTPILSGKCPKIPMPHFKYSAPNRFAAGSGKNISTPCQAHAAHTKGNQLSGIPEWAKTLVYAMPLGI